MEGQKFEAGNTVYAMGRVTTVEKVHANGNFKLAGIKGQWRQGGWKAGDSGYHRARCEHYTEAVAARVAHERASTKLRNAIYDLDRARNQSTKHLSAEELASMTAKVDDVLHSLVGQK